MANYEMIRLVCLDLPTESSLLPQSKIVHRYTDVDMAMAFIESARHAPTCFVVCDLLAADTLSRLKVYRHVQDVFIFNRSSEPLTLNLDQDIGLTRICHSENELEQAVQATIAATEKQALPFTVFDQTQRSSKDLAKEFNAFLWYQVLFHTLRQMPADEEAKEEMLQICSEYYQSNPREEQIIQKYRESSAANSAIHWYTRESFFFKLANQALRTEDMLLVYHFRHWIKQLCSAIECEHAIQCEDRLWTVYRGFQLHKDELERLKASVGSLISINSFLSTTRNVEMARIYAGEGPIEDPLTRVLLQVEANPAHLHSVFFADIQTFSEFPEEEEVLFSLGSTFRIVSIELDEACNRWNVRLAASDDRSDQIRDYCQLANYELHSTPPMIYFGTILNENLDQSDRAVRYFHELSIALDRNHPYLPEIYEALGDAYYRRKEISRSIEYYKITRKIQKERGLARWKPDKTNREKLRQALVEEEAKINEPTLKKVDLLVELADCSNYAQAESCLRQAVNICEQLKLSGPLMRTCLEELAWACQKNQRGIQSLDLLYRRLDVEVQYLPADNQTLMETLEDIINAGKTPNDYQRFIDFCERQLLVLAENLDANHPRLIHMRECLQDVQYQLEDFEEELLERLTETSQISDTQDWNRIDRCYHQMFVFYFNHGLFNESIRCLLEKLTICEKIYGYDRMRILPIFDDIARCYEHMLDYTQAFSYMKKAFELAQSSEPVNLEIVQDTQKKLDNFVHKAARYGVELPWIPSSPDDEDNLWW